MVAGVDLSGPSNTRDTAAAWFDATSKRLSFVGIRRELGDQELLDLIDSLGHPSSLVVGLDAPLSYNPGGGDRPADRELRGRIIEKGLASGSVMPPTMNRMAYLTLRGIAVARAMESSAPGVRIVEVHPGASMVLRGAPAAHVRAFKKGAGARGELRAWLHAQGVAGLPERLETDHEVAACACAVAAWRWAFGDPVWLAAAQGPLFPYDFAC